MGKKCIVCKKGATYARDGSDNVIWCAEHGKENGGVLTRRSKKPTCAVEGCETKPTYGPVGGRKMTHCHKHSADAGMVRLLFVECVVEKCRNKSKYGKPGNVRTHCEDHREEGMVDCTFPTCLECGEKPTHAAPDDEEKNALYCKEHAPEGWIYPFNRSCHKCGKRAVFNYPGNLEGIRCAGCKNEEMIDITRIKCHSHGCERRCVREIEGFNRAIYCGRCCKEKNLKIIHRRQCEVEGCETVPVFGPEGSFTGIRCRKHAEELGYIDVMNNQCHYSENGIRCLSQISHGKIYCASHDPAPRMRKSHELRVADWLKEHFKHSSFLWNKKVDSGCGNYRPDFRWDCLTHVVILEVDENQHFSYSCEAKRMIDIFNSLGGQPVVFIRFNPDQYLICGQRRDPSFNYRCPLLEKTLREAMTRVPDHFLEIHRLYFDRTSDFPISSTFASWDDGDYLEHDLNAR